MPPELTTAVELGWKDGHVISAPSEAVATWISRKTKIPYLAKLARVESGSGVIRTRVSFGTLA
jgi:hypothetical protein